LAVIIIATPKGTTSNSYCDLDYADAYHEAFSYPEAWEDAGEDDKNRALVTATRLLDTWFEWFGEVTTLTQALLWPRRGVLKPGISETQPVSLAANDWHEPFGVLLDQDVVPIIIQNATSEMARTLLEGNRNSDSDIETQGIEFIKAGPVELKFKGGVTAKPIPDSVMAMCTQVGRLRPKSGAGGVTLYRG